MISRLTGILVESKPPEIIIDVNGVGYLVYAPMSTFFKLPQLNEKLSLHIHHVVREDAQALFGFYQTKERELFKMLIKVNGIGPKGALGILSGINVRDFVSSIVQSDVASLVRLPGIGKKTAERLVIELKGCIEKWYYKEDSDIKEDISEKGAPNAMQIRREATEALEALGYKPKEAANLVKNVSDSECNTVESIIREALQGLVKA